MSKSNLFTLFLAGVLVVIGSELLVDEYLKTPTPQNLKAEVLEVEKNTDEMIEKKSEETQESDQYVTQANIEKSEESPKITFELVTKSGFSQATLQRTLFDGWLFDSIDLQGALSSQVLAQNLLKNNTIKVGTFYEIRTQSDNVSKEIYALIKQKASSQAGALVNETNSFGNGSFYINYLDNSSRAFLVVKKGQYVYALTYVKDYHPFVSKLIQLLP